MKSPPCKSKNKSVYTEHNQLCVKFEEIDNALKEMIAELKVKKDHLKTLGDDWEEAVKCKDLILELKRNIKTMRENNDEIEYYKTVSPILFKYFNTFENNESVGCPDDVKLCGKKSILKYLNKKVPSEQGIDDAKDNRGTLYEKYMEVVNKDYVKSYPDENMECCPYCKATNRHIVVNEGIAHCTTCLTAERVLLEIDKPSYKEPPSEVTYYQYRRGNHYNEWINQIQGKQYTDIPNDVIDTILVELNKQKITNMALLTPKRVKLILRKLKLNKYYEHVAYIIFKLSGVPPPRLGEDTEEKLRQMFEAVQVPFLKHAPKGRQNFLSYAYVIRKFLEMLGKIEFLEYFPLQKSREKVWNCETTWKKICEELNWPFIRSI